MRRETASAYLKAAGVGVRPPGGWGRRAPAKPANEVTTGSDAGPVERTANPNPENLSTKEKAKAKSAKPANEVTTGLGAGLEAENAKRSVCEPFREAIELGLSRSHDATAIWQDLVSESGFGGGYQTVKRFVRKLRGSSHSQPRAVIRTGPGEESQVDYGTGAMIRDPQTTPRRAQLLISSRCADSFSGSCATARRKAAASAWCRPARPLAAGRSRAGPTRRRGGARPGGPAPIRPPTCRRGSRRRRPRPRAAGQAGPPRPGRARRAAASAPSKVVTSQSCARERSNR